MENYNKGYKMTFKELVDKHLGTMRIGRISEIFIEEANRVKTKDIVTIDWLSSNLHGVHDIKYTPMEINSIFYSLDLDRDTLRSDIYNTEGFNKKWIVSSDPFNVLCWMCFHIIANSNIKNKESVLKDIYFVQYYKIISGRYGHYFSKYNQDEKVARLAYDELTNKHDIKRLGSNYLIIMHRFNSYYEPDKKYKMVKSGDGDSIVYVINYLFSSINSFVKKSMGELMKAQETYKSKRDVVGGIDEDGESITVLNNSSRNRDVLRSLAMQKGGLVNDRLISLFKEVLGEFRDELFMKVINGIYVDYINGNNKILRTMDLLINESYNYLYRREIYPPYNKDLINSTITIRNFWITSKNASEEYLEVKKNIKELFIDKTGYTKRSTVSSISILLIAYLFILSVIESKDD